MFKFMPFITTIVVSLAIAPAASAFTQQANVKILPVSGKGVPQGKKNVLLDSYLSTRDPQSTRGTMKANPVGTVNMKFPAGSSVNANAVGVANVCKQSEYSALTTLSTLCSKAVIGTGWALLNSGNPTPQTQIPGAPPTCAVGDATQYTRTWDKTPSAGPNCIPVGDIYTKVTAYQGGILAAKYWCYGWDWYNKDQSTLAGKQCYNKDAKGKVFNFAPTGSYPNAAYKSSLNNCNIIFANDNGVAPLAFGGTVNNCGDTLSVIIPSLNGSGSGLGELTGGAVLSDFYLRITNKVYLKAGACTTKKYSVKSHFTYSQLKGETGLPASNPASTDVAYSGTCKKQYHYAIIDRRLKNRLFLATQGD